MSITACMLIGPRRQQRENKVQSEKSLEGQVLPVLLRGHPVSLVLSNGEGAFLGEQELLVAEWPCLEQWLYQLSCLRRLLAVEFWPILLMHL